MKPTAFYMRVNRNLSIRQKQLKEYHNMCHQVLSEHPAWTLTETYIDTGFGRKAKKCDDQLLKLLDEAYSGRIQMIIIPSIVTFTRSTSDSLSIIRKLKETGVDVCFVKEGIDTTLFDTDVLIRIFSTFEDALKASIKKGKRTQIYQKQENGFSHWVNIYGYHPGWNIDENQAEVIRFMFNAYADGISTKQIADKLNADHTPSPGGNKWNPDWISKMLQNERYVGDVAVTRSKVDDYTSHKVIKNPNRTKYIKDHHEGIVDRDLFDTVQEIISMKASTNGACMYPFYGFLICPTCGNPMVKVNLKGARQECVWTCGGKGKEEIIGKRTSCVTYLLPDRMLIEAVIEALDEKGINQFSYREMKKNIKKITLHDWDAIKIIWKDNTTTIHPLHFTQPKDALLPIIKDGMIHGMPIYRMQRLLDGFDHWQTTVRSYRVLPPVKGFIPRVVKPSKE